MKIIFAICSWGYGHIARSLPIIRKLIKEGHEITFVAHGQAKYMLEQETISSNIIDLQDFPLPYDPQWEAFAVKFIAMSPKMFYRIRKENEWVRKECNKNKYNLIISDNRYGIYHKKIPSFLITHQLRMAGPGQIKFFETVSETFVKIFNNCFEKFIVPDFENDGLAGKLCHNLKQEIRKKIYYIGPISDCPQTKNKIKDLDGYISVTGPEPQRTLYEKFLRKQIHKLKGKWVMSLGKTKGATEHINDVTIVPYLTRVERGDVLSRTNFVISRSGYTTMMDLSMSGHRALFSPTPGQPEQEYLSQYHNEKGTWLSIDQSELSLPEDIKSAKKFTGVKRGSTENAVNKVMEVLFGDLYG